MEIDKGFIRKQLRTFARAVEQEKFSLEKLVQELDKENLTLKDEVKLVQDRISDPCISRMEKIELSSKDHSPEEIKEIRDIIRKNSPSIASTHESIRQLKGEISALETAIFKYMQDMDSAGWKMRDLTVIKHRNEKEFSGEIQQYRLLQEERFTLKKKIEDLQSEKRLLEETNLSTKSEIKRLKDHEDYLAGECGRVSEEIGKNRERMEGLQGEVAGLEKGCMENNAEIKKVEDECQKHRSEIDAIGAEIKRLIDRSVEGRMKDVKKRLDVMDYSVFKKKDWLKSTQILLEKVRLRFSPKK